tara:strand:+ start:786 stop:1271 length:486 start_codon:yes stop_codon:yes gene_type:complete
MIKNLNLRKVKKNDIKFIFNLYNYGVSKGFFLTRKKIDYNDHKKWFLNKYNSKKIYLYVCVSNNVKIGYVRFDLFNPKSSKVSIILKKKFQKKGIATHMLNRGSALSLRKFNLKHLYAEILIKNKKSIEFFQRNGFKLIKYKQKFKKLFNKKNYIYYKNIT